jgi:3-phosphoshikimate 1-carboxyvinyltransferase
LNLPRKPDLAEINKLRGTINCPPDKSISQRVAIFSLLREGTTIVKNYSPAADPQSALACVKRLGAKVERFLEKDEIHITGVGREALRGKKIPELDCGNSGTAMRLLSGVIAGAGIETTLIGDESLSARTMKRVLSPLRLMDAKITARNDDFAPLQFHAHKGLKGIEFELPVPSAQLKSCILLAGLFADGDTKVIEKVVSRDHTERMLGLAIHPSDKKGELHRIVANQQSVIPDLSGTVPADFSAAVFWLVAGSIHPDAEIHLPNVGMNPSRKAALDVLLRMGADISIMPVLGNEDSGEPLADLTVRTAELTATNLLEEEIAILIDEIPVLSVAMACANGISTIKGAEELRHKETDRIAAVSEMLDKAKIKHTSFADGLQITGDPGFGFSSANFNSYHDHRIAMSSAVLSLRASNLCSVENGECASISYPAFWNDFLKIQF